MYLISGSASKIGYSKLLSENIRLSKQQILAAKNANLNEISADLSKTSNISEENKKDIQDNYGNGYANEEFESELGKNKI